MDYQKAYHLLFNAITDALDAMGAQNFGQARQLLISAQLQGEALFIEDSLQEDASRPA